MMKPMLLTVRILFGLAGAITVVLGILIWAGYALSLIQLHMMMGLVFVVLLWLITILGIRARVGPALLALTGIWGFVVIALGMTQMNLLPGSPHWLIQLAHLLVGVIGVGLGQIIFRRVTRAHLPQIASDHAISS